MPSTLSALAFGAAVILAPGATLAQPALSRPAGPTPLIIDQERQDRLAPAPPPAQAPLQPPPAPVPQPSQTAPGTPLARVRVIGSTLPPAVLEAAWRGQAGRPLDGRTLQALAQAVSAAYARSDVALYTVVIPRQDLAGGELTIQAVEGSLAKVEIGGDVRGANLRLVRRYAARLAAETPLRRPTLERYLSLMRDIPGLTLDAQLRAADRPGGVVLALALKQKRRQADLVLGSNGQAELGGTQAQGVLTLNGLAAPGDQLRLSVGAAPADLRLYQYYSAAYAARLGADGLSVTGSASQLHTRPRNTPISGRATLAGALLAYPLRRGYQEILSLSLGLDGQNADNAAFGRNLYSDHTRALRGSLTWSRSTATRVLAASATASFGLEILGASANRLLTDPGFRKASGQIGLDQALGRTWVLRLRGAGQQGWGLLPGAEQFALGGDQFGRAFPAATVLGDSGAAGSAEMTWRAARLWPAPLKGTELYGFLDGGTAGSRARLAGLLPATAYTLASGGGGIRLAVGGKAVIGLEGAKGLVSPLAGPAPWRVLVHWQARL